MSSEDSTSKLSLYSWSDQVFQQLFANSPDALFVARRDGLVHWANTSAVHWMTLEAGDLNYLPEDFLRNGDVQGGNGQIGEARVMDITWHDEESLLIAVRDVTFRHRRELDLRKKTQRLELMNADLQHLAHFDPLTAAMNRRGLERKLAIEIDRANRTGSSTAAVLIDFDNFKGINDKYGHAIADRVLVHVTRIFKSLLRPQDLVGRIGGDEFLLILPETREAEAVQIAERLRASVERQPYNSDVGEVPMTISLGLCRISHPDASIAEILVDARYALEAGKRSGKNQVGMAGSRQRTDSGLEQVLGLVQGRGRIRPVSLPIYGLDDGQVAGIEVLSRGTGGPLESPGDLFRACPDDEVAVALDQVCLKTCLEAGNLVAEAGQQVHVNILPSTLQNVGRDELLSLFPSPMQAGRYCLEISEQHVIGDPAKLSPILQALKQEGVLIAIDDVGFGRSSLEALVLLEPDIIKVARRFGRGAAHNRGTRRALERLVRIAKALGATCIAEGLETEADLEVVREVGADYGQGFYWSRPQTIDEEA